MTNTTMKMIVISVGIGVGVALSLMSRKRMMRFWGRTCTGAEWRKEFPEATKESIREILECFVDGFAFSSKKRLKFSPDDKIMDVYKALYPNKGWGDALELETFSENLEQKYSLALADILTDDLPLGELFMVANPNHGVLRRNPQTP